VKRFTETEKWSDPWFRGLTPAEKCLFIYICDNCDNAGFMEVDIDLWAFCIGSKRSTIEGALKGLARGLIVKDRWLWLRTFLRHQKNLPLNPENRAHRQIIGILDDRKSLFSEEIEQLMSGVELSPIEAPSEGVPRGTGKGKGNGNGKGQGLDGESEGKVLDCQLFKTWRESNLRASADSHGDVLDADAIADFVSYWSEPTASGGMRMHRQDAWDTRRRMQTWARNNEKRGNRNTGGDTFVSSLPK